MTWSLQLTAHLHHLTPILAAGSSGSNEGLYATLVIVGGGIITTAMTLIAKSIGGKPEPAPSPPGDDQQAKWAREFEARADDRLSRERTDSQAQHEAAHQSVFVRDVLAAVTTDRDQLEVRLDEARELYRLLREGCLREGLDPDELMRRVRT